MTESTKEILNRALALPPTERARLVRELMQSLEAEPEDPAIVEEPGSHPALLNQKAFWLTAAVSQSALRPRDRLWLTATVNLRPLCRQNARGTRRGDTPAAWRESPPFRPGASSHGVLRRAA